jgi:hypothetical protein
VKNHAGNLGYKPEKTLITKTTKKEYYNQASSKNISTAL